MSILAAVFERERIQLCCDTQAVTEDGEVLDGISSKCYPLPALDLVVCGLGTHGFGATLASTIATLGRTFDTLDLEQLLRLTYPVFKPQPQRVLVAGWSVKENCMMGLEAHIEGGVCAFTDIPPGGRYCHPRVPGMELERFEDYARAQVRLVQKHFPGGSAGGRLVCLEMTRGEQRTWIASEAIERTHPAESLLAMRRVFRDVALRPLG
jgi:hypothetical protein